MGFKQLISFDTSKAGTMHNFCLDNTRRGFGIANKYASAWEAWEHTEQHADRDIPAGLDVPLYYSYTANIDGVVQNYGHINVRLANGTVWSDGTIYANLDAYLLNHWPKYVGWGESVNDFKIIESAPAPEEEPVVIQDDVTNMYRAILGREPDPSSASYVGMKWQDAFNAISGSDEAVKWRNDAHNAITQLPQLQTQINQLTKQITDLKTQLGSKSDVGNVAPPSGKTPAADSSPSSGAVVITKDTLLARFLKWWKS